MGALYSTVSTHAYLWIHVRRIRSVAWDSITSVIHTHTLTQRDLPSSLQSCDRVSDEIISVLCRGPCEEGITYLFGELSSCTHHLPPAVWPWDNHKSFTAEWWDEDVSVYGQKKSCKQREPASAGFSRFWLLTTCLASPLDLLLWGNIQSCLGISNALSSER